MSKGIDPGIANFYGITAIDQGVTYGKRAGFSVSLGPSRCRAARTYWTQMEQDRRAANDSSQVRHADQPAGNLDDVDERNAATRVPYE